MESWALKDHFTLRIARVLERELKRVGLMASRKLQATWDHPFGSASLELWLTALLLQLCHSSASGGCFGSRFTREARRNICDKTSSLFCTSGTSHNRCAIHLLNSAAIFQIVSNCVLLCQVSEQPRMSWRAKEPVQPFLCMPKITTFVFWLREWVRKKQPVYSYITAKLYPDIFLLLKNYDIMNTCTCDS